MTATAYAHIELRPDGAAIIAGTRTKVVLVVMDWLEVGERLEGLLRAYPDLTPGQIHSALAYYYDHRPAMDEKITRRRHRADSLRTRLEDVTLLGRLGPARRE